MIILTDDKPKDFQTIVEEVKKASPRLPELPPTDRLCNRMMKSITELLSERASGNDTGAFVLNCLTNEQLERVYLFVSSFRGEYKYVSCPDRSKADSA